MSVRSHIPNLEHEGETQLPLFYPFTLAPNQPWPPPSAFPRQPSHPLSFSRIQGCAKSHVFHLFVLRPTLRLKLWGMEAAGKLLPLQKKKTILFPAQGTELVSDVQDFPWLLPTLDPFPESRIPPIRVLFQVDPHLFCLAISFQLVSSCPLGHRYSCSALAVLSCCHCLSGSF